MNEFYKTIGTRIGACRVYRDMSRADLAERAGDGLSTNLISRIERGTTSVSVERLVAIAKALGVRSSVLTAEERFEGFLDGTAPGRGE